MFILLPIILPFSGFICGLLFGRFIGVNVVGITILFTGLPFLVSSYLLYFILIEDCVIKINLFNWINILTLKVEWSFLFDSLSVILMNLITFVSCLVHIYSSEYMKEDPYIIRFMSLLSFFTFFMLILVTGNTFLQMFIGWEGVGLASYLLINFWYTRIQANKSAIKAMLVNRVGDYFLLLAIFSILFVFNTADYQLIRHLSSDVIHYKILIGNFAFNSLDLIIFFLFLGAMGKSAQMGFHTWLPDAMEGPTPVSALLHAATMVTAGVFLVARCTFLFNLNLENSSFIMLVGCLTCFFASTTGLMQNDMKKIIAFSTCSQLGYMFLACGLVSSEMAIFHLFNHGFFKALLFLSAGSIIHSVYEEQDLRKIGSMKNSMPFSYASFVIGSFALMAFPYTTGFYSKDSILESSVALNQNLGFFCYFIGSISALFTSFYSCRLIILTFLVKPNSSKATFVNSVESSYALVFPLFLLCILSCEIGFQTKDFIVGFGSEFFKFSITSNSFTIPTLDREYLTFSQKIFPTICSNIGIIFAFILYLSNPGFFTAIKNNYFYKNLYTFFNKKWYFDRIFNQILTQSIIIVGYSFFYKLMERGLSEFIGPSSIISLSSNTEFNVSKNQKTYYIQSFFIIGIFIAFVFYFLNFEIKFSFVNFLVLFLVQKELKKI